MYEKNVDLIQFHKIYPVYICYMFHIIKMYVFANVIGWQVAAKMPEVKAQTNASIKDIT